MCVVSAIGDNLFKKYIPEQTWIDNRYVTPFAYPIPQFNDEQMKAILKLIKDADKIDKMTGQPECHDPVKTEKLKNILASLNNMDEELQQLKRDVEEILGVTKEDVQ